MKREARPITLSEAFKRNTLGAEIESSGAQEAVEAYAAVKREFYLQIRPQEVLKRWTKTESAAGICEYMSAPRIFGAGEGPFPGEETSVG